MTGTRERLLAGMGALAVTLGGVSFAWACSGQPLVVFGSASGQASGPAGSTVTVSGSQWASEPVHIRWNSVAADDLATPKGPSFSVAIKIPESASTGVHTIYFVQYERNTSGNVAGEAVSGNARLAFEVTPAGSGDVAYSAPEDNTTARTSASTSGADEAAPARSASTGASAGEGQFSTGTGERSGATSGAEAPGAPSGPAGQSFGNLAPAGATTTPAERGASASAQTAPATGQVPAAKTAPATATGQAVFGGSVAPSSAPVVPGAPGDEAQASPRSASGDVWAGFESNNASLVPGLGDTATGTSRSGSPLAIGMGLFSVGLGMLFAGFGVAEVRRQRAFARQS